MSENEDYEIKKIKETIISEHITDIDFQKQFASHWQFSNPLTTDNLQIIHNPFRICKLSNFIKSKEYLEKIKSELNQLKTSKFSIDLYQLEQTNDLVGVNKKAIKKLFETFQRDLADWMERNTKIKLNKKMSMSSHIYRDTDYLLCHDDRYYDECLGDRKIAFILYLTKDWTEENGGTLDLFDVDELGQPRNVIHSLIPEYNSLVFFEVTHKSYHQVAEILSLKKARRSISGWFYAEHTEKEDIVRREPMLQLIEPENTKLELSSWISDFYLNKNIKDKIQKQMEKKSYVFLSDYFNENLYENISKDLEYDTIKWIKVGPADVCNYEIADASTLPETLKSFFNMFKSIVICQLLKDYTELDLVPETDKSNPKITIELQRWTKGCYTLIRNSQNNNQSYNKKNSNAEIEQNDIQDNEILTNKEQNKHLNNANLLNNEINSEKNSKNHNNQIKVTSSSSSSKNEKSEILSNSVLPDNSYSPDVNNKIGVESEFNDLSDYELDEVEDEDEDGNIDEDDDEEEDEEEDENDNNDQPGSLDVIIQFNTDVICEHDITIDYIDTTNDNCALIHVPARTNHMCLVYKKKQHSRLHSYINHYCEGYFYNLICTYYE